MGKEYARTRHNVGNLCLDYIVKKNRLSYKDKVNPISIILTTINSYQ
jgi:peptidyl-tRNA hydrolase